MWNSCQWPSNIANRLCKWYTAKCTQYHTKTLSKITDYVSKSHLKHQQICQLNWISDNSPLATNQARIIFKNLTLVHHCIYDNAREYLKNFLKRKQSNHNLRSCIRNNCDLEVPFNKWKTFGNRSFNGGTPPWTHYLITSRQHLITKLSKFFVRHFYLRNIWLDDNWSAASVIIIYVCAC